MPNVTLLYPLSQNVLGLERDGANLYVLEAIIISMILLGAAYAVSTLQNSSIENVRPRAELSRVVDDTLTVLAGLDDGNGTALLDLYLLQAMHCATDAVPSVKDCHGTRSKNLTLKLDHYLPKGAGYAISLGNGAAKREIYSSPLPEGEGVAASRVFAPEWNTSFVFTEFSCYPSATDINATMVPIDKGRVTWMRYNNVTVDAKETKGERAFTANWWNVTIAGGTRPDTGTVRVNATGNASLNGSTTYGLCAHDGLTSTLRTALKDTTFGPAAPSVPLSGSVAFTADLGPLQGVAGLAIVSAIVDVYSPLPPDPNTPDTWLRAGERVTLTGGTGAWTAPADSFYGTHPALLRVTVTVGSNTFELRRATTVDVALASGEVPIEAPYRAVVRAWMADWG